MFFADNEKKQNEAKLICFSCPVRNECRAAALENKERYGVWGGETKIQYRTPKQVNGPNKEGK